MGVLDDVKARDLSGVITFRESSEIKFGPEEPIKNVFDAIDLMASYRCKTVLSLLTEDLRSLKILFDFDKVIPEAPDFDSLSEKERGFVPEALSEATGFGRLNYDSMYGAAIPVKDILSAVSKLEALGVPIDEAVISVSLETDCGVPHVDTVDIIRNRPRTDQEVLKRWKSNVERGKTAFVIRVVEFAKLRSMMGAV